MTDREIDTSDLPEVRPERFARAIVRKGLRPVARKAQITLRIDAEVLQWFRSQGAGYQSRMNAVLGAYRAFCEEEASKTPATPARRGARARTVEGTPGVKRGATLARPK